MEGLDQPIAVCFVACGYEDAVVGSGNEVAHRTVVPSTIGLAFVEFIGS